MYWTGLGGRQILYKDLTHDHFMNIIADGYRNPHLIEEGKNRGIDIPKRAVDSMTEEELDTFGERMIKKALEGKDLSRKEGLDVLKVAKHNLERLKSFDYQTYLLYISRYIDNRDESLRD